MLHNTSTANLCPQASPNKHIIWHKMVPQQVASQERTHLNTSLAMCSLIHHHKHKQQAPPLSPTAAVVPPTSHHHLLTAPACPRCGSPCYPAWTSRLCRGTCRGILARPKGSPSRSPSAGTRHKTQLRKMAGAKVGCERMCVGGRPPATVNRRQRGAGTFQLVWHPSQCPCPRHRCTLGRIRSHTTATQFSSRHASPSQCCSAETK
jgi:hypothetical protein